MVFVLSTFSKRLEAQKIAKLVIEKRLAGCVLTIPVGSMYRLEGKIKDTKEVLAVFKTTKGRAGKLMKFIQDKHPYEVPFVAVVSLKEVSKKYLKWIEGEVRDPSVSSG